MTCFGLVKPCKQPLHNFELEIYMAEARKSKSGKYIMFEYNCPIIQIAQNYWEACSVETELFRNLLHANVAATHRAAKGDLVCRFEIEKRHGDVFEESASPSTASDK